jgi:hypothetical protein
MSLQAHPKKEFSAKILETVFQIQIKRAMMIVSEAVSGPTSSSPYLIFTINIIFGSKWPATSH